MRKTVFSENCNSSDSSACEILVSPLPRPRPGSLTVQDRPTLKRVVLIDSFKPNSLMILTKARDILVQKGFDVPPILSRPISSSLYQNLKAEVGKGIVLSAIAD